MRTTLLAVVVTWAIAGCATTETVYVSPSCSVPPMPAPPEITAPPACPSEGECLTDHTWRQIVERDAALTDALLEHRAMLRELCE